MNSLLVEARNRGDTYLQNALYRVDTAAQDVMNFQRQVGGHTGLPDSRFGYE